MTPSIKRAWIAVSLMAVALLALLVTLLVVSDRLHEGARALLPKTEAVERYEVLAAEQISAEAVPAASSAEDRDGAPTDSAILAMHSLIFERYSRNIQSNQRWEELYRTLFGDEYVDLLDPQTWSPYREFLEGQQGFLAQLREAAAAGGPVYLLDFSKAYAMELPHLTKMRDMARLLRADALWHAANGDFETYTADMVAVLNLGKALAVEPVLLSQLVRAAIGSLAYDGIGTVPSEYLSPAQVRELQAAMHDAAQREAFADGLAGEAQMGSAAFDMVRSQDNGDEMFGDSLDGQVMAFVYSSPFGQPWVSADEHAYAEYMNSVVEANRLPYYQGRELTAQAARQREEISRMRLVTHMLAPAMDGVGQAQARWEAMVDLTQLGLEIEQYQAETGALPQSLDEIAGRLGGTVPVDPHTGESYIYRPSGDSFQLYSAGENLTDDHGRHDLRQGDIVWRGKETEN